MTILTRQERERLVLDLYYNQGKPYREISKEARISPRDIGVILNKVIEQKKTEGLKEQQDNDDAEKIQEQQHLSLAAQVYKLASLYSSIVAGRGLSKLCCLVVYLYLEIMGHIEMFYNCCG